MDGLRLLLVEADSKCADERVAVLAAASHSVFPVRDLEEAVEALTLQRFDAILVGPAVSGLAEFQGRMRSAEVGQGSHSPISVIPLPPDLGPSRLIDALTLVKDKSDSPQTIELPIFEEGQFEDQCAGMPELMVEIVDLFLTEREIQVPQMRKALETGDFPALARVAHTLKGSLGSLHAPVALSRTQALENAAKNGDRADCQKNLVMLETDLRQLEPLLSTLREACLQR